MICPRCGAEYVEGFTRCADCGVDLVERGAADAVPGRSGAEVRMGPAHLVPVLVCTDAGLMAVAESALRSAGIPFVSERDDIIDLFGVGRVGGVNPITGLPRILVDEADVDDALQVLQGEEDPAGPDAAGGAEVE